MSKKSPFAVRSARGTKITPEMQFSLDKAFAQVKKGGFTVLDSLVTRTPGLCTFYAMTYRSYTGNVERTPPFGVTRVTILNNGQVTCRVMGTDEGQYTTFPTISFDAAN